MQASDKKSADVLIQYFIVAKDKVKINTMHNGYHGHLNALNYNSISHVSTHAYVEGTLVIDVIDYSSKKSVWRSTLTKPLKKYKTPEERDQAINNLVRAMFSTFPAHQQIEKRV